MLSMSVRNHGHFGDPHAAATYAGNARDRVPGLDDLHRMVTLLLAEGATDQAHILVVGAGGGMETKAMASAQPTWRFTGVDPSPAMVYAARLALEPFADRVRLLEGTVEQVPLEPFDGATCLLIMHHLTREERLHTLTQTHQRLRRGARLIMVEHTAVTSNAVAWMARSVAFGERSKSDRELAEATAKRMVDHLTLLTPDEEVELLVDVGFEDIEMFYAALSFRGWVAIA